MLVFAITCRAEANFPRIQFPSNPKLEEHYALHPDRVEGPLKILVDNTKELKAPEFISARDANKNLQWRVSSIIVISADVVAIKYNEGHVEVIGIYTWDHSHNQWIVATEHGGTIRERAYAASEKNSGEQAAPSNR